MPIVPGLKIVTRPEQVRLIPKHFGASLPEAFVEEVVSTDPERVVEVGTRWALEQTRGLFEGGAPSVHFYVMQNTAPLVTLLERLWRET
jgi:methylenetetrahydrofolate reductase (NADPH)